MTERFSFRKPRFGIVGRAKIGRKAVARIPALL